MAATVGRIALDFALVLGAKYFGKYGIDHVSFLSSDKVVGQ